MFETPRMFVKHQGSLEVSIDPSREGENIAALLVVGAAQLKLRSIFMTIAEMRDLHSQMGIALATYDESGM